jgi:hypothetical protein
LTAQTKNPLAGALLEIALDLSDTRGRRIVEQAAFRRAISSAYYALFHTLCQVCGEGLNLWTGGGDDLALIYRNLEHGRARQVLGENSTKTLHPDLVRVSEVFAQLRQLREDADYSQPGRLGDKQKLLTKSETRTFVAVAGEAVALVDGLPSPVRRRLAILLTVTKR